MISSQTYATITVRGRSFWWWLEAPEFPMIAGLAAGALILLTWLLLSRRYASTIIAAITLFIITFSSEFIDYYVESGSLLSFAQSGSYVIDNAALVDGGRANLRISLTFAYSDAEISERTISLVSMPTYYRPWLQDTALLRRRGRALEYTLRSETVGIGESSVSFPVEIEDVRLYLPLNGVNLNAVLNSPRQELFEGVQACLVFREGLPGEWQVVKFGLSHVGILLANALSETELDLDSEVALSGRQIPSNIGPATMYSHTRVFSFRPPVQKC